MRAEEADSERPRLPCGGEVRTILSILLAEEAMARTGECVRLERLAQRAHGGVRRGNRGVHTGIISSISPRPSVGTVAVTST